MIWKNRKFRRFLSKRHFNSISLYLNREIDEASSLNDGDVTGILKLHYPISSKRDMRNALTHVLDCVRYLMIDTYNNHRGMNKKHTECDKRPLELNEVQMYVAMWSVLKAIDLNDVGSFEDDDLALKYDMALDAFTEMTMAMAEKALQETDLFKHSYITEYADIE